MMAAVLGGAAGFLGLSGAGALGYRAWRRAGAARRLRLDGPRAVAEERFVRLGGVEQWVGVRGEDRRNPVLLVLHGGPGSTYSVFTPLLRGWERDFTVVQWDRRGTGKTLGRTGKAGTGELTYGRMVADGLELVELLRQELGQPKVVVLASSAGTPVGLQLVQRRPDLFAAFVGTDLNVGTAAAEAQAFPATVAWARAAKDGRALGALARIGLDPERWSLADFDQLMRLRDRTVTVGKSVSVLFPPLMLLSPQHTLRDVRDVIAGLGFSLERLFEELVRWDARRLSRRFDVPFFVFQGEADVFMPPGVVRAYFDEVEAPLKHLELLPHSGHLGAFMNPEPFLALLRTHVLPAIAAAPTGAERTG